MKALLEITTQQFENYGDSENMLWKQKSKHVFHLDVDMYMFMHDEKRCIEAIELMLFESSNEKERFMYVSHELVLSTPTKLHEQLFLQKLKDLDSVTYVHE
jgi:hypothetical protein